MISGIVATILSFPPANLASDIDHVLRIQSERYNQVLYRIRFVYSTFHDIYSDVAALSCLATSGGSESAEVAIRCFDSPLLLSDSKAWSYVDFAAGRILTHVLMRLDSASIRPSPRFTS